MAIIPKTPAIPDESSSLSVKLTKCYKRLADLETRIHKFTIMGTMIIPEFTKLKEAKKRAQPIEVKQTAQRFVSS